MTTQEIKSFKIENIRIPFQFLRFEGPLDKELNMTSRLKTTVTIINDNTISVLFGVVLFINNEENEKDFSNSPVLVVVNSEGLFSLDGELGKITNLNEITFLPNFLATIFPFLREKISTAFGNNQIKYYLPSYNLIEYIKNNLSTIEFKDLRNTSGK